MKCHGNNDKNGKHEGHSKHMLMMILCCALPVLILVSLPFIKNINPTIKNSIFGIAPLICPVMMIGMMFMMKKTNKNEDESKCRDNKQNDTENKIF